MIKRRKVLSTLAAGLGAVISLPSWANGWSLKSLGKIQYLDIEDEALLIGIRYHNTGNGYSRSYRGRGSYFDAKINAGLSTQGSSG